MDWQLIAVGVIMAAETDMARVARGTPRGPIVVVFVRMLRMLAGRQMRRQKTTRKTLSRQKCAESSLPYFSQRDYRQQL